MSDIRSFHRAGKISPPELKVLKLLCEDGSDNKTIANTIGMSSDTVKHHLTSLYRYSGVKNRTALALWWIRTGRYEHLKAEATHD